MAIVHICDGPSLRVALLAIDQDEEYYLSHLDLDEQQLSEFQSQHHSHRLEWLASRWLLCQMTNTQRPPYVKDEFGKPHFTESPLHFSISHTTGFAAAIISERPVGIDVQGFEEKTMRIRGKFISAADLGFYESDEHFADIVHVYWGAKESMYKAWGKRGIDFRQHLFLDTFNYMGAGGSMGGHLEKEGSRMDFDVQYQLVEHQYLVWTIAH